METTDLRPLTLGELLDRAFVLYRQNFWLFVGIMAIPSAASIPFSLVIASIRTPGTPGAAQAGGFLAGMILLILAFTFFSAVIYVAAYGAATHAVSESYLGRKTTVRDSYGKVRGKFSKMLGVMAVTTFRILGMGVVVMIGLAILVIGGAAVVGKGQSQTAAAVGLGVIVVLVYIAGFGMLILWSIRYAVSIPALLVENVGVLEAIRRSIKLTSGRRWQIFAAVILSTIVAYVGIIIFQGPFFVAILLTARGGGRPPAWLSFASSVSGAIGGALTGPFLMIVLVLWYYDSRIRKEAFDLQFMMTSLDGPAPSPEPVPPA